MVREAAAGAVEGSGGSRPFVVERGGMSELYTRDDMAEAWDAGFDAGMDWEAAIQSREIPYTNRDDNPGSERRTKKQSANTMVFFSTRTFQNASKATATRSRAHKTTHATMVTEC